MYLYMLVPVNIRSHVVYIPSIVGVSFLPCHVHGLLSIQYSHYYIIYQLYPYDSLFFLFVPIWCIVKFAAL